MDIFPPLFLSHGSPMIALDPGEAGAFMGRLGATIEARCGRPEAILAVSAHTRAGAPAILGAATHAAVYDFGGFDPELSTLRYDVAGAPALARRVAAALAASGVAAPVLDRGGLDHGIWTALRYLVPEADIPVLPLALVADAPPAAQFALGEALARFAQDGILIVGTGSITHNLRRLDLKPRRGAPEPPEIAESFAFRTWFAERSRERDWDALFDYRRRAPHATDMHPTDEHLLPWFVAAGAGGRADAPQRLHDSVTLGALGMDAYVFGTSALALLAAVPPARATV